MKGRQKQTTNETGPDLLSFLESHNLVKIKEDDRSHFGKFSPLNLIKFKKQKKNTKKPTNTKRTRKQWKGTLTEYYNKEYK